MTVAEKTIVGLDVGGTKTLIVEGTPTAQILQCVETPTAAQRPFRETWDRLAEHIDAVIGRALAGGRSPEAISVAIGGPLVAREGQLLEPPNLPGWHHVALADTIAQRFPGFPVRVEHDAKAAALAEWRFGVGRDDGSVRDLVFLTFGTGLGAGIITGGELVRGSRDLAGEVWRLVVRAPDGAQVGGANAWESVASGRGIAVLASRLYPSRWPSGTTPRVIIGAALTGDPDALAVITECGRWLGAGIAALVTILDPQVVALGSLAVVLGDRVLAPARAEVARQGISGWPTDRIIPTRLGASLGAVQSLMAAIGAERVGTGD